MRKLLYLAVLLLFFSSCGWLNPSIMFKTGKDYQYSKTPDSTKIVDYKISPNDVLEFNIYTNDGFKLVDLTNVASAGSQTIKATTSLDYLVETDGNVKLPVLGRRKLSGLTIREAESMLEENYSAFYVKPFVMLKIMNKKVIVFMGNSGGTAKIVPLLGNNTTVLEAIAMAGGIPQDGKSRQVKLIRTVKNKHEVYLLNLSTIKGLNDAYMVLQANDIIYVEARKRIASKTLTEITPILSLLTTALLIFSYTKLISK
jgi:polysaccharide export outer membrane protein